MKQKITIAIIGRPNVGKSALFNRLLGRRLAIVDEAEGITRDRLIADAEFFGQSVELVDTGGIDPHFKGDFQELIRRQAEIAIEVADTIIMVVDSRIGVTTLDEEVANILLRTKKKICLAVNKVDDYNEDAIHAFHSLGISSMIPISTVHGFNILELVEEALKDIPQTEYIPDEDRPLQIALIGRPNVGKSTLFNKLVNEERSIVSPIAGTTRDSIDVKVGEYLFIDTAGIRRKAKEKEVVEKFSFVRTQNAIERADICFFLLDARDGLTHQEKKIAMEIEEKGKGCVLLLNKWDLVKGHRMEHCLKSLYLEAPFLAHCPILFISAKTGRNISDIFPACKEVAQSQNTRVGTGELNSFVEKAIQRCHPPMLQGKRLRLYYMTQISNHPPRFVLFVNNNKLMTPTYKKYLINQFRKMYKFTGVPLHFILRGKKQQEAFHASQS